MGLVCDLPDLSVLIAPRPQSVESGISDMRFPYEPAYSMAKRAYGFLGVGERLELHRYRGGTHVQRQEVYSLDARATWRMNDFGGCCE